MFPTQASLPTEQDAALERRRAWLWPNILSLDAPVIAVLWQTLFAASANQPLLSASSFVLALTVWLIYSADRVLDGFRSGPAPVTARHLFHMQHRKLFALTGCLALLALLFLTRLLDERVVANGLILSAAVGLYLLLVHLLPCAGRRLCPKELLVGMLFAAGTCLAPWTLSTRSPGFCAGVVLFAALCFLNCSAIELWEWEQNGSHLRKQPHGITVWIGKHVTGYLLAIAAASTLLLFYLRLHLLFGSIALSSIAFFWLAKERHRLSADAVRVLTDAPLLAPIILFALRALIDTGF